MESDKGDQPPFQQKGKVIVECTYENFYNDQWHTTVEYWYIKTSSFKRHGAFQSHDHLTEPECFLYENTDTAWCTKEEKSRIHTLTVRSKMKPYLEPQREALQDKIVLRPVLVGKPRAVLPRANSQARAFLPIARLRWCPVMLQQLQHPSDGSAAYTAALYFA